MIKLQGKLAQHCLYLNCAPVQLWITLGPLILVERWSCLFFEPLVGGVIKLILSMGLVHSTVEIYLLSSLMYLRYHLEVK